MPNSAVWYGLALRDQWNTVAADRIIWPGTTDTIKIALLTSVRAPVQDTDQYFNVITNEVTGTNYAAGGTTLTNRVITYDSATNETRLDADDAVWSNATISGIRYASIYKATGVASTSHLMGFVDFGADLAVVADAFTIRWDATGVLKVTEAA